VFRVFRVFRGSKKDLISKLLQPSRNPTENLVTRLRESAKITAAYERQIRTSVLEFSAFSMVAEAAC
jgi:hypothetical protein